MEYKDCPVKIFVCKKERIPKVRNFFITNHVICLTVSPSTTQEEMVEYLNANWHRVQTRKNGTIYVHSMPGSAASAPAKKKQPQQTPKKKKNKTPQRQIPANGIIGFVPPKPKSVSRATHDTYRAPRFRSRFYDSASEVRPQQRLDLNSTEHYNRRRDYTETPSERAVNVDHGTRLQRHNKIHQSPHVSSIHLTNQTGIAINTGQKVIINGRIADRSDIDWREQD